MSQFAGLVADHRSSLMMHSPDASLYLSHRTETMRYFVRDADGDAVYFVHRGNRTVRDGLWNAVLRARRLRH